MHILLVEDNVPLAVGLICALKRGGFVVNHVTEGKTACLYIKTECPGIVILDLGLPDMDGGEVLNFTQKHNPGCQVLVLSERHTSYDKVLCLDSGAVDYMSKPFAPEELMARLRVLERRMGTSETVEIVVGSVSLNTATHKTTIAGETVQLSRKEYLLLKALMENDESIHTREELEDKLCLWGKEVVSNAVDVHIYHLRKKLPPGFIQTVRGIGYMVKK